MLILSGNLLSAVNPSQGCVLAIRCPPGIAHTFGIEAVSLTKPPQGSIEQTCTVFWLPFMQRIRSSTPD
jgi:hypothetical protein